MAYVNFLKKQHLDMFEKKRDEHKRLAAASCAMKHEISNDVNFASVDEIRSVMENKGLDVAR